MRDIDEIIEDLVDELVADDDGTDETAEEIRANTQRIVYFLHGAVDSALDSYGN